MNIYVQSRQFGEFLLEWEMLTIKAVEKIQIHCILCSVTLFRKSCLYEIMSNEGYEQTNALYFFFFLTGAQDSHLQRVTVSDAA